MNTYYSIHSGTSKCLIQTIFPIAFAYKCHSRHNLDCIYRAHGEQDHQNCLREFDWAYIFAAFVQVRNGVSALICISYCLSVCKETSVLCYVLQEACTPAGQVSLC